MSKREEMTVTELSNFLYEHGISIHTPDTDAYEILTFLSVKRRKKPKEIDRDG